MMAQNATANIRKFLDEGKLVVGAERTLKLLRVGKISQVFIASNCATEIKESLNRHCSLGKIECTELALPSDELGAACRKPFAISVVGVLKTA